jgi:ribose transport system substrate-binding protein
MTTSAEAPATPRRHRFWTPLHIIEALIIIGLLAWHFGAFRHTPRIAIITSGEGPYWDRVEAGAKKAADQYDVNLTVVRCKSDMATQIDAINQALADKYDGIAVSPINPSGEAGPLANIAGQSTLVTLDSDSPVAGKLCFVGTDNYEAGRLAGQLVKDAIPDGGEVIISIGNVEKQNTQRRRQGVIDELLDRSYEEERPMDPVDQVYKGDKYSVVATLVDNSDANTATELTTKALKDHPNVKCIAGLLSYSANAIYFGVQEANKEGRVKIVGFDADEATLSGIEQGKIASTVMQDQFGCGYHAVRILGENARGNRSQLPVFDRQSLPCMLVTKETLPDARKRLSGGASTQPAS